MKLYVAGPMRGIPEYNYPAFHAASSRLRAMGHIVLCPAESFGGSPDLNAVLTVADFARYDLHLLLQAEGIVMLDGWGRSPGASTELVVAKWLNLPVFYLNAAGLQGMDPEHPLNDWLARHEVADFVRRQEPLDAESARILYEGIATGELYL